MTRRARSVYRSNIHHSDLMKVMPQMSQIVFHDQSQCSRLRGLPNAARSLEFFLRKVSDDMCDVPVDQPPEFHQLTPGFGIVILAAHPLVLVVAWESEFV